MTDLLVQRLKTAKRELTALKTAHRRGLGLLKVYLEEVALDVNDRTGMWFVTITLDFDTKFAPFPFVQGVQVSEDVPTENTEVIYSNDGYTCELTFFWIASIPPLNTLKFVATSPIVSSSQSWTRR